MHFGFMKITLLHSDHRHVSATNEAIFRVVSASIQMHVYCVGSVNALNAELSPIYHLLALLGAHHILHVSWIRVKQLKSYSFG